MIKKVIWILISCLMVLSLVLASCGPGESEEAKVEEEDEGQVITTKEQEKEEVVEEEEGEGLLPPEVPKYGGVITVPGPDARTFDIYNSMFIMCNPEFYMFDRLLTGNWAMGQAEGGTGEATWMWGLCGRSELWVGNLAETWDMPDGETIIYHIQKGVNTWNKPPSNGREYTAEDVAWVINNEFTNTGCYMYNNYTAAGKGITSVKALDKYTVEVKVPSAYQNILFFNISDHYFYYSPDPFTAGLDPTDWRNLIGTGPYMLTDYVGNTSQYYTRNPDYYMVDPLHTENHLPYADLRVMVISDASTQLAGFRTGKIDFLKGASWEDGELLLKQKPELQYKKKPKYAYSTLCGREDKEELPFKDVRVRQALNLAINNQEMVDDYYGGNADILGYPCANVTDMSPYYIPLEEQPAAVQELFTYNPEKARALLTEAGYPNGFKTQVVCGNNATVVDLLSIVREYFLDINVDMEITPVESSVFSGISRNRSHEEMIYTACKSSTPFELYFERLDSSWNVSFWHDDRVDQAYKEISAVIGRDDAEVSRIMKEITPFILEQAWGIWLPADYDYFIWWPWLQNCHGEWGIGNLGADRHWKYFWKDDALKKAMGY